MALVDTTWYCNAGDQSTTGYYAVTKRPQSTAVAAGIIRRQFTAPAVGSERCFVCIIAGTTANTTDATWTLTRGVKVTDGTATWQECTGQAALNGDLTNTATWAQVKAATPAVLGQIIKRSNNASYQICTTAGAMSAAEPTFSDTAGTTTTDTTAVWTSLGPVSNFTGGQAPFARLQAACTSTWFAAGNTVYVGDNHAESQASAIAIAPTLNQTTLSKILCADSTKYPPVASGDLKTTATITTTGTSNLAFTMSSGSIYVYGIQFIAAIGSGNAAFNCTAGNAYVYFDACLLKNATTGALAAMGITSGSSAGVIVLNNTTVYLGAVGQYLDMGFGTLIWQNTGPILAAGSVVPTNLIGCSSAGRFPNIILEAIDLSQITGNLNNYPTTPQMGSWLIKDCKLNAATAVQVVQNPGQTIQLVRSSSS